MDIKELIQKEIKSIAFVGVSYDTSLINSNILDSLTVIDLAIFLEEQTDLNIPARDINSENFDSINKIADYLKKRKNN
mgnify:FL=1|tara:strand:- start:447 stop:680 length:234 start_codon:yes stop_codon:yes gene_type:complete